MSNDDTDINRFILSEEKKLVYQNISDRHTRLLSHIDSIDSKLAQLIALNGVIIGLFLYLLFPVEFQISIKFGTILLGLILIVISMIIGFHAFAAKRIQDGITDDFFYDYLKSLNYNVVDLLSNKSDCKREIKNMNQDIKKLKEDIDKIETKIKNFSSDEIKEISEPDLKSKNKFNDKYIFEQLIKSFLKNLKHNTPILEDKGKLLRYMLILNIVGVILMIVSFYV